eukprot:CAMPEP_0117648782 /NCGR_PEP_ID=MMETSP0804-20121206/601_1 /TAXON_ID=1074897 /ORGANISM="Tetraselmis astigmatica, Strain CCMP880" /LENGTH=315 /DNA_ID=CAMNT_0005454433 /DNA_START=9 /DNA_END=953 /DNA_ORIENTATION=+
MNRKQASPMPAGSAALLQTGGTQPRRTQRMQQQAAGGLVPLQQGGNGGQGREQLPAEAASGPPAGVGGLQAVSSRSRQQGISSGNRAHMPIQVRDTRKQRPGAGEQPSAAGSDQLGEKPLLKTAEERTRWLVTELQAHYQRACMESHVASRSVPEQACKRLLEIGKALGNEQRSSSGPHFVAAMQAQAFPLIELVRQSIGTALPGNEVVIGAAAVMKELSNLGHMEIKALGSPSRRGSMFGADDFLDAHVGSHFEDDMPDMGMDFQSMRSDGRDSQHRHGAQQLAQGAVAQRQHEQREAQRQHQQISVGSVGVNK